MGYEFLEHKSDALFRATGKTYEEALESAANAMFEVICDSEKVPKSEEVGVEVSAPNIRELTVGVLAELLSEMQINELFFNSFKVTGFQEKNGAYSVKGVASGAPASPELGRTDVKAVTYHEFEAVEGEGGWSLQVLLDI